VSGVVLANASLDTAFHDKLINNKTENDKTKDDVSGWKKGNVTVEDKSYIEAFFVGLLEGDGTITSNLNSNKSNSIIVRIVISLKNTPENLIMLNKIKDVIGGRVVIERKNQYVT
jgi:hypothetical protein